MMSVSELKITDQMTAVFDIHQEALREYAYLGLTAISDPDEVYRKHFLDSLQFSELGEDLSGKLVVDLGSGGGFPGVPLKALFPCAQMVLVEANGKKAGFLSELVKRTELPGLTVVNARAEDLARGQTPQGTLAGSYREKVDVVVARALTDLRKLLELAMPLLKVGGKAFFWKSQKAVEELNSATNSAKELSVKLELVPLNDIGNGVRFMVVATKQAATKDIYPRPFAQIAKRPL